MMKWWLKLYTLNTVLTFSKWLGLSWILDYALTYADGVEAIVGLGVYAIPLWATYTGFNEGSFRANLEFHKMSVPFKELKKAFYTHLLLVFTFLVIAMLVSVGVSNLFGGVFSRMPYLSVSQCLLMGTFAFICFLYANSFHRATMDKYAFYDSKISLVKKFFRLILSFVAGFIFFAFTTEFAFEIASPMLMVPVMLGATYYYSRSLFHQSPARAGMKQFFGYTSLGAIGALAIFFTFAFMGRNDFQKEQLSSADRLNLILFWRPMTPEIDKELFVEIEPTLKDDSLAVVSLYRAISHKEMNSIPFTFFIDAENPARLEAYLKLGNPDAKNLAGLLDHMESKKEFWEKSYKKQDLYKSWINQNWPPKEKFPERHIVARLKWEELHPKAFKVAAKRTIASEVPAPVVQPEPAVEETPVAPEE
jgi:hypothetical protein